MRLALIVPARGRRSIEAALAALFALNVAFFQSHPNAPHIRRAGVRYARERGERWQTAPVLLASRRGDCEDLASYHAAFLRARGERAVPQLREVRPGLWHVVVRRADGRIDDPSRWLGMGARNG
jgi:hypothetical protein